MKCPLCNKGNLKKGKADYSEFGIYFGKYSAEICNNCGEVYFSSRTVGKIQEKSKKLGLFGMAKRASVSAFGNNLAITIPKEIAKFVNLKKGQKVLIRPYKKDKIEIEKISKGRI